MAKSLIDGAIKKRYFPHCGMTMSFPVATPRRYAAVSNHLQKGQVYGKFDISGIDGAIRRQLLENFYQSRQARLGGARADLQYHRHA